MYNKYILYLCGYRRLKQVKNCAELPVGVKNNISYIGFVN